MKWISVKEKLPEVDTEDILMTNGEDILFGYYGYFSDYDKSDGVGFIDYARWNSQDGYWMFEEDITLWCKPEIPKS